MTTRRDCLALATMGAVWSLAPRLIAAQQSGPLITRPIPSTGERLPIIGLGSSTTFSEAAGQDDTEAVRSVLAKMLELGGKVFDTAPCVRRVRAARGPDRERDRHEARDFLGDEAQRRGLGRAHGGPESGARAGRRVVRPARPRQDRPDPGAQRRGPRGPVPDPARAQAAGPRALHRHDVDVQGAVRRARALHEVDERLRLHRHRLFRRQLERGGADLAAGAGKEDRGARLHADGPQALVPDRQGARRAGLGARVRSADLGAVHPEIRRVASRDDRRDAGDRKAEHMVDNMGAAHGRLPTEAERKRMVDFIAKLPG